MKTLASLVAIPVLFACGSSPRGPQTPAEPSAVALPRGRESAPLSVGPEASVALAPSPLTTTDKAPGDECRALSGWKGDVAHRRSGPPAPVAGQMTAAAAQAKRLFDSEKWAEAVISLGRVTAGATGDDDGNRHIADYMRAIALYRLRRFDEAAARFRVFSRNPAHAKFAESLLWLVRLATEARASGATRAPASFKLDDIALYTPLELARFDNTSQLDIYGRATYMLGHQRYDEGNVSEAKLLFEHAKRIGPWSREAEVCLAKIAKTEPH